MVQVRESQPSGTPTLGPAKIPPATLYRDQDQDSLKNVATYTP
ncbi:hypothetical protein FOPG_18566 [Fusarium oxysporum f. sp. conglutinans race 2 54008]|uniref:Uncharacterized protein n=1 Tax=Fusarium oxysporum f. sp. conglutinans race 2 54008 TaxID=1089457 RepID=X0GNI2_FUSOX|nr:hypothetical protein FOPG_18566 [Fusarium oxysporum f. sp. conglutinans race 2 54008]